jgi:hypothetical protein
VRNNNARNGVCLARVTAARRSSINSMLKRLSGGFASVSIPRRACRTKPGARNHLHRGPIRRGYFWSDGTS